MDCLLKNFIDDLVQEENNLFISWDVPLSAAIDKKNFSLTIRK